MRARRVIQVDLLTAHVEDQLAVVGHRRRRLERVERRAAPSDVLIACENPARTFFWA